MQYNSNKLQGFTQSVTNPRHRNTQLPPLVVIHVRGGNRCNLFCCCCCWCLLPIPITELSKFITFILYKHFQPTFFISDAKHNKFGKSEMV